jgi:Tfp pilus assembly protein PilW
MTRRFHRDRDESGFTLIEFLVAMSLMMVLITVSITVVKLTTGAVATTQQQQNLNEEARQAINRMTRDIRQATVIVTAINPDGVGFNSANPVAVRFTSDFNGDGCIGGTASCAADDMSNPEDITYCYAPATQQLYVIDNYFPTVISVTSTTNPCAGGQPLLAGNVSAFKVSYRSNAYRDDLNPTDGVTTWAELDEAGLPDGNNNGVLDVELSNVDSVVLNLTMSVGGHQQVYRTQVDLRNQSQ